MVTHRAIPLQPPACTRLTRKGTSLRRVSRRGATLRRLAWGLLIAITAVRLVGCSFGEDLEGRDDDVLFPALRVTWDVHRPRKTGLVAHAAATREFMESDGEVAEGPPRRVEGSLAVDFDLSFGSGKSSQDLQAGENFHMDALDINGPARVSHDYDLWAWSFAARGGLLLDGYFGLEAIGGLAFEHLDIEASSGGVTVGDEELYSGPLLGAQISLIPLPWCTMYARGSVTFGFLEEPFDLTAAETGVSLTPDDRISIFAAWRWWDLEVDRDGEADIELELSGPVFGLEIHL